MYKYILVGYLIRLGRKVIKVRITGGLGNQLFKFFHGLKIAHIYDENLIIDKSWFAHNYMTSDKVNNRTYELSYFDPINLCATFVARNAKVDLIRGQTERRVTPLLQKLFGCMTEQSEHLFTRPPRMIDGSFEKISDLPDYVVISKYLKFPEEKSIWLKNELAILGSNMIVAIHVRRTDYLKLPELYNVLTTNYYRNAVNYFNEKYVGVKFWLFSDDIEGAQVFLNEIVHFDRIVKSPINISIGENLQLMSNFKGIIIANSTFSWWAAYLGHMSGRTIDVVLPSRFSNLNNDNPAKYLKLHDWNMLEV
jgi:hypothetical protein